MYLLITNHININKSVDFPDIAIKSRYLSINPGKSQTHAQFFNILRGLKVSNMLNSIVREHSSDYFNLVLTEKNARETKALLCIYISMDSIYESSNLKA